MKQLLFYITCFFCLQQTFAQYTQVPDPNFEEALINLGIDSEGTLDGQFLTTDALGITALNIDNQNIFDLTGIEAFVDLEQLFAYGNSIENVDLFLLPADLWTLDLANNNLSFIDLSPVSQVVNLYLSLNNLSSIDASNMTNVFILEAIGQPLNNINLTNCTNLFFLDVYETSLQTLDLSTCSNLAFLTCFDSQLTSLDFTGNPEIEEIRAYNTPLNNINLPNNPNLELLYISDTQLTNLDITNCPNLLDLRMGNNSVTQLDFSNNTLLEHFDCIGCQLTSLDITNNPNLKEVWCRDNIISGTIDFSNNPQLDDIDFSYNQLEEINLSQNAALEWVFIDNNPNLTFVNMQNGANDNLFAFVGVECPQLNCVVVDDPNAENDNIFVDANTTLVGSPEDCNLAISENELEQFVSIYPNPVRDVLRIKTQENITINNIQIFNLLGSIVYQEKNPSSQINITNLASGLLFVQIDTNKGSIIKKVIKE